MKVNINRFLLLERRKNDELKSIIESCIKELKEAVASKDIASALNKYLDKINDPAARGDFLMTIATFLGRKSDVTPAELEMALRQHYAKNYDPAKVARGQTPAQRAGAQAKQNPPPLPAKAPPVNAQPKKQDKEEPPQSLPSLSQLASDEDPWKRNNLPSPDELEKSRNRGNLTPLTPSQRNNLNLPSPDELEKSRTRSGKPSPKKVPQPAQQAANGDEDEDLPILSPKDFKMVGHSTPKGTNPSDFANQANKNVSQDKTKKAASRASDKKPKGKEVDMDKIGTKEPTEKPTKKSKEKPKKSAASSGETPKSSKNTPLPSFSSIVKPKFAGTQKDPKWKKGQTVNLGHAGDGYKVKNKTGSWYNLEKDGQKYIFEPFKGLRKV